MATNLLSVAGLVGSPITVGSRVGRVIDLVVRHGCDETYPEITGFVIRVGRRSLFAATKDMTGVGTRGRLDLRTASSDLELFDRRESDVLLAADVLDRQIVDTDGVHVIRAADLYLAVIRDALRLIALDTSVRTLVRRLGPRRLRSRPAPQRVIDWSQIETFAEAPEVLHLCAPVATLDRIRAGELASIVHDLAGARS